jgi:Ubiquitin elongating factor core
MELPIICSRQITCGINNFLVSLVQFFDRFNIRHNIAELLEYLWEVPSHKNALRQVNFLLGLISK